ncbi:uncharacterized protein ACIBXB_016864 isoform 3-T12 [Morphnus guianensis]
MEVRWTKKLAVRDVSTFFSLEDRSPLCLADEMPRVWEKPLRVLATRGSELHHLELMALFAVRGCPSRPACLQDGHVTAVTLHEVSLKDLGAGVVFSCPLEVPP